MSEWGPMSDDLFRSARRDLSPSSQDRARIRGRIAARLAAGAVAATVTSTTTKAAAASTAKTVTLGLVAKIVAPILVVGGMAAVVAPRVVAPAKDRVPVAIVVPSPAKTAATKLAANAQAARADAPVPPPASSAEQPAAPGPRSVVRPTPQIASAEEVVLVAEIDAALRSGDAARATQLAADHERKFPRGLLVEEREGARVIARCMSGSRSGAATFLAAHPRSPMRARIVAACAGETD